MSTWFPDCYQRATAYLTDTEHRLLVFDHVDAPSAGTQVPAGGIQEGEHPVAAVHRELFEESGVDGARLVRKLGEAWHRSQPRNVPPGLEEQIHHAFHLQLDRPTAVDRWRWDEKSGGEAVEHRFELRWVTLDDAASLLWPSQSMWLDTLRVSLANSPTRDG